MRVAKWVCIQCDRTFVAEWFGPAFFMGTKCPLCGGTGMSNEDNTWEDGALRVEDEVEDEG